MRRFLIGLVERRRSSRARRWRSSPARPRLAGDAELAGVGAGAGGDVDDRARAALAQADRLQLFVQVGTCSSLAPSGARCSARRSCGQWSEAYLCTRSASSRICSADASPSGQRDGHGRVAGLALAVDVGLDPLVVLGAELLAVDAELDHLRPGLARRLVPLGDLVEVLAPATGSSGIVRSSSSTSRRNSSMPSFCTRNFSAGLVAVLLLAQPGEDAADGAGQRQQLFLGDELGEQLRLVRHGAEAAADVELEAADFLAVDRPAWRRCRRGRGWLTRAQASCSQPEKAILNLRPKSSCPGGRAGRTRRALA